MHRNGDNTSLLQLPSTSSLQQSTFPACLHCAICHVDHAQGWFSPINKKPANPTFLAILSLFHHLIADNLICCWQPACSTSGQDKDFAMSQKGPANMGVMCTVKSMAKAGRGFSDILLCWLRLHLRAEEALERINTAFCCLKSLWLIAAGSGPL